MDPFTAIFRIAARQAAKPELDGARIPLEDDAIKEPQENYAEFFVAGACPSLQPPARQAFSSGPTIGAERAAI